MLAPSLPWGRCDAISHEQGRPAKPWAKRGAGATLRSREQRTANSGSITADLRMSLFSAFTARALFNIRPLLNIYHYCSLQELMRQGVAWFISIPHCTGVQLIGTKLSYIRPNIVVMAWRSVSEVDYELQVYFDSSEFRIWHFIFIVYRFPIMKYATLTQSSNHNSRQTYQCTLLLQFAKICNALLSKFMMRGDATLLHAQWHLSLYTRSIKLCKAAS